MKKLLVFGALFLMSSLAFGETGAVIRIANDFDSPLTFEYISGGSINATEFYGDDCKGFIATEPDHVLILEDDFDFLKIYTQTAADKDPTMIIKPLAEGSSVICDDDTLNYNPQITASWPKGTYHIFIGSFKENELFNYSIYITTDN